MGQNDIIGLVKGRFPTPSTPQPTPVTPVPRPGLWDFIRGYLPQDPIPVQKPGAPVSAIGIRG